MKYCINCGTQLDDDAKFCHSCGNATEPTAAQPAPQPATEPAPASVVQPAAKKSGKEKLTGMRDKTVAFENKHSLIVNLLVLCCSFVILMVSLFAPIKVSGYAGIGPDSSGQLIYADVNDGCVDYTYVEVEQNMFDVIGALFYISPSEKALATINKEMDKELRAADKEYSAWRMLYPSVDEETTRNKRTEIYQKHISNANYLGYLLANTSPIVKTQEDIINSDYDSSDEEESENSTMGLFTTISFSVSLGLAIVILSIVMAIMSLVNLIKAIIGLCKKKTTVKFDKYMFRMFALSGASLVLMWVSPLLATGGGMFGISMFVATVLLITGVLRSLFVRGDNWLMVIKRGVTAFLCMLAFYLLCSNIFVFSTEYNDVSSNTVVKPGYAVFTIFNLMDVGSGVNELTLSTYLVGFVMYVFTAGFIMSFAYNVFSRSVRNVAKGGDSKPVPGMMIAVAVLMLVGLVYGLVSGTIINSVGSNVKSSEIASDQTVKWLMSGHVWSALVLTIAAIVLHFAFRPENICKGKTMTVLPALDVEPVPAAAAADGATAEAPAEAVVGDTTSETATPEEEPVPEEPAEQPVEPAAEDPAPEQTDIGEQAE